MATYLLIESRSPWESGEFQGFCELAQQLAASGNEVALYLVQNGVLAARRGARGGGLQELAGNMRVLADDFSLRERGMVAESLVAGVAASSIESVVDLVAAGAKAVWH